MKRQGSVTVFSALCLMLISSFLAALLDAARVYMLDAYADMTSELAMESVCAEYQPTLWEDYHLLCLDGAYGGESFSMDYVEGVLKSRIDRNLDTKNLRGNLLTMEFDAVQAKEYQLMTDGEGKVFLHRIAAYMKENISAETARILYERYRRGEEIQKDAPEEDSIENAQKAIDAAKENQKKEAESQERCQEPPKLGAQGTAERSREMETQAQAASEVLKASPEEEKESPLEIALALKENAVLGMVVENTDEISTRQIDTSKGLMHRECQKGTAGAQRDVEWQEKVFVLEYLDQYYTDYTSQFKGGALSYEMEYVLCGKESDRANLEGVVNRLLLIREAANVTHILGDSEKRNAANLIANSLAGFSGNPAVIKVVQIGIVGAWAYMESVQDVRALLRGDKIALIKNEDQWTVHIDNLLESFESAAQAKNCENGLSYQSYLKLLLFGQREKLLAYRMMDVMEQNMQLAATQQNCRMDYMICQVTCRMDYRAETMFWRGRAIESTSVKHFSYY